MQRCGGSCRSQAVWDVRGRTQAQRLFFFCLANHGKKDMRGALRVFARAFLFCSSKNGCAALPAVTEPFSQWPVAARATASRRHEFFCASPPGRAAARRIAAGRACCSRE